jgi:hypothetical protein
VKPARYMAGASTVQPNSAARSALLQTAMTATLPGWAGEVSPAARRQLIDATVGVSKPTVFTTVGNKAQLLKAVRDVAMAGDDDPVPVAQRLTVRHARDVQTAEAALRLIAAHISCLSGRYAHIDEVLHGAAAPANPNWLNCGEQTSVGAGILLGIIRG